MSRKVNGKLIPERKFTSGTCSPIFPWSPLPQRKQLNFIGKNFSYDLKKNVNFYPNCDTNVWMRSCETEIIEPIVGKIEGFIPEWLEGSLFRNGPGSLKVGNAYFKHLFDSSALLHRFNISEGTITYQCKFLQSDVYKKNWTANRIVTTEFGTQAVPDPCRTIFQKISAVFNPKANQSDNAMISLYPFGDELYAFNEIPIIHRINKNSLETDGKIDISKYVSIVHHTSHPHILGNEAFNLGLSVYLTGPHHTIILFPQAVEESPNSMFEQAKIVASIPTRWPLHPSYMHTFGLTENYFVIVEQPLSISLTAMMSSNITNEALASCLRWFSEEYNVIHLISRKTGEEAFTFYAQTFFYLHIINQYELSDHLILDICIYRDPAMIDCMYIETMKTMNGNPDYAKMFRGRPARFVFPLKPKHNSKSVKENLVTLTNTKAEAYHCDGGRIFVKPERLCDLGCETPRINYEKYLGKPYRYFYAISSDVDAENPGTIIKVDTINRTTKTWCEDNCYPSEPIFVPSPNSEFEDDGVILAAMVWGGDDTNHAGVIILDAKNFTELGRAEFQTPSPVPKCLHGWFLPTKS